MHEWKYGKYDQRMKKRKGMISIFGISIYAAAPIASTIQFLPFIFNLEATRFSPSFFFQK